MTKKNWIVTAGLGVALVCGGAAIAQRPGVNIDPAKFPNLAGAQQHIDEAYGKLDDAQKADQDALGGHAEKAKALLAQASREVKEAADYARAHGR